MGPDVGDTNVSRQAENVCATNTWFFHRWHGPSMATLTLGERLRALRGDTPQAEIAAEVGCQRSHLSNIEKGKDNPILDLLGALALHFRVTMDWLWSGREPRHLAPSDVAFLTAFHSLPDDERETYRRLIIARGTGKQS